MSDRLKYERFLWFHGQIKAGRFPNAGNLADNFELSGRTAQRDIEFIRDRLDAPLQYHSDKRGYCYSDSSYELPSLWISESNILALSLAVRLASTIPDQALKDQLCRLIDRIPMGTGDKSTPCLERLSARISVKNIEYSQVNRDIFRQTVEALFAGTSLHIVYYSPHTDTTTTRIIHPLHLMHYMGSWHLIAWCGTRKELRNFALSRIRTSSCAGENLDLPEQLPELKEYTRQHFGIMQGDTSSEVGLRFAPKIASRVSEQIWHPRQRSTINPDGSLTLHFPVADMPRIDPETGHGLVTDVCLKRKIRNYVSLAKEGAEGFNIYIQEKAVLNRTNERAYKKYELKSEAKKLPKNLEDARKVTGWMCSNFYDIRSFGAVMTTEVNCGQVRGPVQLAFAKSVDPIVPQEISITRMAVTNEKDLEKERTMGRKHIVPYGLYVSHGFISAPLAEKTDFGTGDLSLLWDALVNMFEHDRSAARGMMSSRKLFVFKHENKMGNAPAHKLFDLIDINRAEGSNGPARSFRDYSVSVGQVPKGVTLEEKL